MKLITTGILFAFLISFSGASANEVQDQLLLSAYLGETEKFAELYETHHLDINYRDADGWSAIWHASYWENLDTMDYILEQENVDVNTNDYHGFNLLYLMLYEGKWEVVKRLKKAGAKE